MKVRKAITPTSDDRIIQTGNYHQPMAEEGMFRDLARRQLL